MPKFPPYESAIHHFLLQSKRIAEIERLFSPSTYVQWQKFIESFQFEKVDSTTIRVTWKYTKRVTEVFSISKAQYYTRGDTTKAVLLQKKDHLLFSSDAIKAHNDTLFFSIVSTISRRAGLTIHPKNTPHVFYDGRSIKRFYDEEQLSDDWAKSVDVNSIDVQKMKEACTAPEMRYITKRLGNIKGKKILDIGCGLGEASVYFAMKGAKVLAMDISHYMTDTTRALAKANGVSLRTYQSSIEHLVLPKKEQFDIIYVGNLFHHVDIDKALDRILVYLKPKGMLVSWDPVDYNPIINIYRRIATKVRSKDERPIRIRDIDIFKKRFLQVESHWFWFTTLIIFIIMALIQKRNPNTERFWKVVVKEGDSWKWLYAPLERLDAFLLHIFPQIKYLCWNVVLIMTHPRVTKSR